VYPFFPFTVLCWFPDNSKIFTINSTSGAAVEYKDLFSFCENGDSYFLKGKKILFVRSYGLLAIALV
jgi:hypothetical protein